jgi:O-6-methylguanine DNA methyltransferase
MNLNNLRNKINKIDNGVLKLLIEREKVSKEIGILKLEHNIPVHNPQREKEIIQELSKKFNPALIKKVFTAIFMQSKKIQKNAFTEKVYNVVRKIKKGKTMTYLEVATLAGNPKAVRAVGNILNKNYDPKIPCHRVIRSDGKTGGYNRGSTNKAEILKKEKAI